MPRTATNVLALAAMLAAGACGGRGDAAVPDGAPAAQAAGKGADAVPEPRLATLAELQAAVKRNLERGALVSFWATW